MIENLEEYMIKLKSLFVIEAAKLDSSYITKMKDDINEEKVNHFLTFNDFQVKLD